MQCLEEMQIVFCLVGDCVILNHMRVTAIVAPVDHPLPTRARLREASHQTGSASACDPRGAIEIGVPSGHQHEVKGSSRIISRKCLGVAPVFASNLECQPVVLLQSKRSIDVGARRGEIADLRHYDSVNFCTRHVAAEVFEKRSAQDPVANVVKFDDENPPARVQIEGRLLSVRRPDWESNRRIMNRS
jgi:hypothetical protein